MGRSDLIGSRPDQLVPAYQPPGTGKGGTGKGGTSKAAGTRRPGRAAGKPQRFTTKGVRLPK
jgi:hypothetical protein